MNLFVDIKKAIEKWKSVLESMNVDINDPNLKWTDEYPYMGYSKHLKYLKQKERKEKLIKINNL
jgi:hypothetical protein